MKQYFNLNWLAVVALILLAACHREDKVGNEVEYFSAPGTEGLDLPFSAAVRVGNTLYLSGNIGNVSGELRLVEGGVQAETRQTMENIRATLEVAGATMDQVVKCTVFMADMREWDAMNEVYRTYFRNAPARSATGASALVLGARVEIECIAALN